MGLALGPSLRPQLPLEPPPDIPEHRTVIPLRATHLEVIFGTGQRNGEGNARFGVVLAIGQCMAMASKLFEHPVSDFGMRQLGEGGSNPFDHLNPGQLGGCFPGADGQRYVPKCSARFGRFSARSTGLFSAGS